ncbi:MAG: hypothetical protein H0V39_07410 [Nitrosomonas sp.]|nr:hypothetical protein [Nitrosomonas sp.]
MERLVALYDALETDKIKLTPPHNSSWITNTLICPLSSIAFIFTASSNTASRSRRFGNDI